MAVANSAVDERLASVHGKTEIVALEMFTEKDVEKEMFHHMCYFHEGDGDCQETCLSIQPLSQHRQCGCTARFRSTCRIASRGRNGSKNPAHKICASQFRPAATGCSLIARSTDRILTVDEKWRYETDPGIQQERKLRNFERPQTL